MTAQTTPDLSTWLGKPEAAAKLGISERTLDRLGAKGPERRLRPRPGKKPEPVFNPDDVDTIATASKSAMVIPAGSPLVRQASTGIPPQLEMAMSFLERVATMVQNRQSQAAGPSEKLWLTIPEASEYTGLSETCLRNLVRLEVLPGIKDRATKIRREDLDNLDTDHMMTGMLRAERKGAQP